MVLLLLKFFTRRWFGLLVRAKPFALLLQLFVLSNVLLVLVEDKTVIIVLLLLFHQVLVGAFHPQLSFFLHLLLGGNVSVKVERVHNINHILKLELFVKACEFSWTFHGLDVANHRLVKQLIWRQEINLVIFAYESVPVCRKTQSGEFSFPLPSLAETCLFINIMDGKVAAQSLSFIHFNSLRNLMLVLYFVR